MSKDQAKKAQVADLDEIIDLRILATTDLHACLLPWDYFTFMPALGRGLAPVGGLIAAARAEVANSVLFDNGDFLNGSGLGDYMAQIYPAGFAHPMIAAMNALRYDAASLGNHEFSHGLAHLAHALKDAQFPVITSNYDVPDLPDIRPTALLLRQFASRSGQIHALKLGVIGLLPNQTMIWEAPHLQGRATAHPLLERARSAAQDLRQQGADIVIALAHTGMAMSPEIADEQQCAQTVLQIPEIDAVIAGHSHTLYPPNSGRAEDTLAVVQAGFFGSHLGILDLTLGKTAMGWRNLAHAASLRPIAQRSAQTGKLQSVVRADPQIEKIAQPTHAKIMALSEQVIGHLPQRLHSYFATIVPSAAVALVAQAKRHVLTERLAGTPHAGLPILAAVSPFKAGGRGGPENFTDLLPGNLRHHSVADLYIHPNSFVAFRVTGDEVRLWLERAVSKYTQILPGQDDALIHNPAFPSFNCDMIFGLTYQIDISQPPMFDYLGKMIHPDAARIVNLRHNGRLLRPDQTFALASNSYRLGGDMGFAGTSHDHAIYQSTDMVQTILHRYIAAGHPIPRVDLAHWSFVPLPGRTALFHTSPKAAQVLDDIAHFKPQALGLDADGFLTFRLHL